MNPNRSLPESTPPRFCGHDGKALLDRRYQLSNGFDRFTGMSLGSRDSISRACPTPGHEVWVLIDGRWVRP